MKILIVDDEPLVRAGMRSIIDWEKHHYEIVAEAANGMQALEAIRKYRPHIVLTDIIMPVMDGVELIRQVKAERLGCRFIVLSCVTEARHLQQAINLGISRYVLKSTTKPEHILEMVDEVAQEIRMQSFFDDNAQDSIANQNIHFNELINMVLKHKLEHQEKIKVFLSENLPDAPCFLLVTRMENGAELKSQSMLFSIASVIQNIIGDMGGGYTFVNYEDYICSFFRQCKKREVDELYLRIQNSINDCFDVGLSFGLWDQAGIDGDNLAQAYEVCCKQLDQSYYQLKEETPARGQTVEDLTAQKLGLIGLGADEPMERFLTALGSIRALLIHTVTKESETKKLYLSIAEYILQIFEKSEDELLAELGAKGSLKQYLCCSDSFEETHQKMVELIKAVYTVAGSYLLHSDENIDRILYYIWGNWTRRVTLDNLAQELHFRPDYICKYFKKKTGVNLVDYILQYKVLKARALLGAGESVSAVAEQLGFSSDSHFSKTFKKYTNISPSSFSTKLHKGGEKPAKLYK